MELVQSTHITDRAFQHYLRGSLPEIQARAVEQHYLACRACNDRMILLEWFPDAKPIVPPPTPVLTISCNVPSEPNEVPVLQRALSSARTGFELLAGSDQILGVTAVASMAVLVLSVSLSVLPNRQPVRSDAGPVSAEEVFDGAVATHSALNSDDDSALDRDDADVADTVAPRRRRNRSDRNTFAYAKVFVPPEYTPSAWRFGTSEPVLHAAPPEVTFQVSAPHIPFEPPKLEPPHTSRIKSVLKILSWPFRSEHRDTRPGRTIS